MARLNESTAPTESIEALKRRFVRQNREIARVNSIQSLRIRSLESEISQLLAENVSLREQAIALSQELERYQAVKLLQEGVYDIKSRLDVKLTEFNNLVAELGELPRNYRKKNTAAPITSSTQSVLDWERKTAENELSLAPDEDGKLPVILEDKYYPRKTLEAQDIQGLLDSDCNVSQSPAFNDPSSVDTNNDVTGCSPNSNKHIGVDETSQNYRHGNDADILQPRAPGHGENSYQHDVTSLQSHAVACDADHVQVIRSHGPSLGEKRKFSAEIDDRYGVLLDENDDFEFRQTRSPSNTAELTEPACGGKLPFKKDAHQHKESKKNLKQARRKILEQKSTNFSINSPKQAYNNIPDGVLSPQGDSFATVADGKGHETSPATATLFTQDGTNSTLMHHDPGTSRKADEGNINTVRESEALGFPSKDEQSEPPISGTIERHAVAYGVGGSSRPTRRQRAVVSYAEPNLRDKMRRPTNELVAAVGDQTRRTSGTANISASTKEDEDTCGRRKSDAMKSQVTGVGSKSSPSLPLNFATESPSQSMKMVSHRKRKASLASNYDHAVARQAADASGEHPDDSLTGVDQQPEAQNIATPPKDHSNEYFDTRAATNSTTKTVLGACQLQQSTPRQPKRRSSSLKPSEQAMNKPGEGVYADRICADITPTRSRISPPTPHELLGQPGQDGRASTEIGRVPSATSVPTDPRQIGRSLRAAARRKSMML
ncbi:shugoshin family protein [Aspergillus homomorphus CBS 101889]|uniref:Shugoshin n=1 Tax=Aspergillus homomorphus (strain CBS 101889) TaxID=1450537 RepID=A0A395I079_ASPHC|nr:hypothetical protein BO97DRAFT_477101 [Aspergillus homomorphus CBS 101889]RAL13601.1 hypothetical protein BO97DRAFT_477101 [Aspergillus homomorphus CBS 101889]